MVMISDIKDYFAKGCGRCARFDSADCSARLWSEGLKDLRGLCLQAGLTETVKWGHPCYMHAGRNIAIIGAFRDNFRLTFFEAGLLRDQDGVLQRQGAQSAVPDMIRFDATTHVADHVTTIAAYLKEAMGYAKAGLRAPKVVRDLDWPQELTEALDIDPELAEAFAALTPGRQKSYLLNLNAAKQAQTRITRIAKFRDKIIAGKGAMER